MTTTNYRPSSNPVGEIIHVHLIGDVFIYLLRMQIYLCWNPDFYSSQEKKRLAFTIENRQNDHYRLGVIVKLANICE